MESAREREERIAKAWPAQEASATSGCMASGSCAAWRSDRELVLLRNVSAHEEPRPGDRPDSPVQRRACATVCL